MLRNAAREWAASARRAPRRRTLTISRSARCCARLDAGAVESKAARKPTEGAEAAPPVPRGDKLLIVGLGNPGAEYDLTRHNIGFYVVDALAERLGAPKFKLSPRFQALTTTTAAPGAPGRQVTLMKPMTYMNLSGKAVGAFFKYHKIASRAALLVVVDDTNLDFGRMRVRAAGSAGGHNGLKSIQQHFAGKQDYPRLRVGVGAPRTAADLANHVLAKFKRAEQKQLDAVAMDCLDLAEEWLRHDNFSRVSQLAGRLNQNKQ